MSEPLWRPSRERIEASNLRHFMGAVGGRWRTGVEDWPALHRFSIEEPAKFWTSVREFAGLIAATWGETALIDGERMPGARFFPDARLNFAENLLRRRDDGDALVFWTEGGRQRRLSWRMLVDRTSQLAQALAESGVGPGDRVAGFLPNLPEAVVAMLAATSLGAIWSSCSPDFGVDGVIERFGQIEPKVLIAADGAVYGGRTHDALPTVAALIARLPSLGRTIVVPHLRPRPSLAELPGAVLWDDLLARHPPREPTFARLPFDHPVYVLYSSGTTGKPKGIVHGAGGTLLKHACEHQLHCDLKPNDRVFHYTTCGWMMWNWLVSALASGATLILYDGSPLHPEPDSLFALAAAEGVTLFGTSAKYLDSLAKVDAAPGRRHDLSSLRTLTSTGSPLAPATFDYVHRAIKEDLHLASISGGTDLIGCFVLGNPLLPVWRGEIQGPGLGMAVDVFDAAGRPAGLATGELVCTRPWPSMPVRFWNDPDGSRYHAAYFARFPNVWCHGDFVSWTEHGGLIIHGRSDATLNPGGVRIGTAEIYRQVERLPEVKEALAVGQEWRGDVRVILFVTLRDGFVLDEALAQRIRQRLRACLSPRHVPARILQVPDLPRTKNGKLTELAVREVLHGRPVVNQEALANPEALNFFRDRPELAED